jgi:hypothetical protein
MSATRAAPLLPTEKIGGSKSPSSGHAPSSRERRVSQAGVIFGADRPFDRAVGASSAEPSEPSERLGLFDALAPLVTDVLGAADGLSKIERDDPFQGLIADIAIHRSRETRTTKDEAPRRALLRAIAEMAETHAVAADLACEQTAIDLPLDVPDPVVAEHDRAAAAIGRQAQALLIVPDMIRTCRDRLSTFTSAADRVKIDIVATLFDHVLADDRLATDIRNTLARLQLPVLRMALADESFFDSRSHPTRRLLDRLVASAADLQHDSPGGRTTRTALERVVHTVIRGSFEDADEHARLLEQFERAVTDIAAASAKPVAPIADEKDRDVLVIKATIQIRQLLAGVDVNREVRFFLLDVWSRVLIEIACRRGDSNRGALLARAKRLCFDLAWSTAPKVTSGDRARLAGLLPTMIASIRDGLRLIDYPVDDEHRFFADWTRALTTAVRGAPGMAFRAASGTGPEYGIDAFARYLREGSFGPEPLPPIANRGHIRSEVGLRTADHTTPSMLPAAEPTGPDAPDGPPRLDEMRKGQWFELRDGRGVTRVRLSWVSPLRSFYLFIGDDGGVTRSFDPAALSDLVDRGDLRWVAG